MATPYTTGPCHIWVVVPNRLLEATAAGLIATSQRAAGGTAGGVLAAALTVLSRSAVYLGTGERAPRIKVRRKFSPLLNDIGGDQLQFDDIYEGEDAFVSVTLTRWNETVYQIISSQPFPGDSPFGDGPGDIGTLMTTEGALFPLIIRFPNYDFKPAMRAQGMRPGYRFYAAGLVEEDELEPGTAANKRHLMWHARRVYVPARNNLVLGDFNVTGIPALAPN